MESPAAYQHYTHRHNRKRTTKVKYLIQINMSGLHRCIYTMRPLTKKQTWSWCKQDAKLWYAEQIDKPNSLNPCIVIDSNQPHIFVREGITQILFDNKKEAERTIEVLLAYQDHIRRHI